MAAQFPSIQSYFGASKPNVPNPTHDAKPSTASVGDGFTDAEVEAVLHPKVDENWLPDQEYEEFEIASLIPGPNRVTFRGRIANYYNYETASKKPRAAKGCVRIVIKDDTGAITVRLWYAKLDYQLRLGQLVTVWTPHISNGEHGNLASYQAPLFTSIFPERDRSCYYLVHENSDNGEQCKLPLRHREGRPLSKLMTLENFVNGGYDVVDNRILVCVKSIGAKKRGWRIERKAYLSITSNTLVDVDPLIPDTLWLRNYASRLTRREDINPAFPSRTQLNVQSAQDALNQIFFTFADLDEFARAAPAEEFIGWASVILTEINLALLHRRNMLLCGTHCGFPMYANSLTIKCKQCSGDVALRLNPKIIGRVVDETGCSAAGKLYLSDDSWEQLFGRSTQDLCRASADELKLLQQRMLYIRVTLGLAWWAEETEAGVGRVWVWAVKA